MDTLPFKAAQVLEKLSNPVSQAMNIISVSVLAIMIFFVSTDVFLRYLFSAPIEGSYEAIEYMMVFVFVYGIAYTQNHKGHVDIDIVVNKLKPKIRAIIETVVYFISFILFSLITWRVILRAGIVLNAGDISFGKVGGIGVIPLAPLYYFLAIAFAVLALVLLVDFFTVLAKAVTK